MPAYILRAVSRKRTDRRPQDLRGLSARKHAPWTDFSKDHSSDNQPFTSFPTSFAKLPTVAWVVPNLDDDMHDGTIQQARQLAPNQSDGVRDVGEEQQQPSHRAVG